MTKAQQILDLYALGKSTREIADEVGCLDAYVRVVARQRKGRSRSEIDLRYQNSPRGQAMSKRQIPRKRAYMKKVYETSDLEAARLAGRKASKKARLAGATPKEVSQAYTRAYHEVCYQTSDASEAKQAYAEATP